MPGRPLWQRVVFTSVVLAILLAGQWIPLPLLPESTHATFPVASHQAFGLLGLGILPYLNAAAILMLFSGVIPAWGRMRDGAQTQRAAFDSGLLAGSFVLATLMAIARGVSLGRLAALGGLPLGFPEECVMIAGPLAACMLMIFLAFKITESGVGNGLALVSLVTLYLIRAVTGVGSELTRVTASGGDPTGLLMAVPTTLLLGGMCVMYLRDRVDVPLERVGGAAPRNDAPAPVLPIRLTMVGAIPGIAAATLMVLPPTVASFFPGHPRIFDGNMTPIWATIARVMLILIVGALFTYAAFDARKVEPLLDAYGYRIAGLAEGETARSHVAGVIRRRLPLSLVLLVVITMATQFARFEGFEMDRAGLYGMSILVACAVGMDTWRNIESHRERWSITPSEGEEDAPISWQELARTDTELEARLLACRLDEEGIAVLVRNDRALCLTGTLGLWESVPPRFPILFMHRRLGGGAVRVLVAEADRERALAIHTALTLRES